MIAEQVRGDTAHPEYHERPEHRLSHDSDQHLDAAAQHRLDQNAGELVAERGGQVLVSGRHVVGAAQVKPDRSGLGLVHEALGLRLEHNRAAQHAGGGDRLLLGAS